jgi:hypothetical protein
MPACDELFALGHVNELKGYVHELNQRSSLMGNKRLGGFFFRCLGLTNFIASYMFLVFFIVFFIIFPHFFSPQFGDVTEVVIIHKMI